VLIILTILLSVCFVLMFLDDLHVHLFVFMKRNEMYVCSELCLEDKKVKVKISLLQAMKAHRVARG
jgi:hypothetical protein